MGDAGWEIVPADPEDVPGPGRQDHRHAARDWQRRAASHVGGPQLSQEQGRRSCCRSPGSPGQGFWQEVKIPDEHQSD